MPDPEKQEKSRLRERRKVPAICMQFSERQFCHKETEQKNLYHSTILQVDNTVTAWETTWRPNWSAGTIDLTQIVQ